MPSEIIEPRCISVSMVNSRPSLAYELHNSDEENSPTVKKTMIWDYARKGKSTENSPKSAQKKLNPVRPPPPNFNNNRGEDKASNKPNKETTRRRSCFASMDAESLALTHLNLAPTLSDGGNSKLFRNRATSIDANFQTTAQFIEAVRKQFTQQNL